MATNNTSPQCTLIFEHTEQDPLYVKILCILLFLVNPPLLYFSFMKIIALLFIIWILLAVFVSILSYYYNRFNFYYIVTFNDNQFSIGVPVLYHVQTCYFSRKIKYHFNEKSRFVYMNNTKGVQCRFRYDKDFQEFLEEIQISN